jgi:sarcosine oxidase delta subunit
LIAGSTIDPVQSQTKALVEISEAYRVSIYYRDNVSTLKSYVNLDKSGCREFRRAERKTVESLQT